MNFLGSFELHMGQRVQEEEEGAWEDLSLLRCVDENKMETPRKQGGPCARGLQSILGLFLPPWNLGGHHTV